MEKNEYPPPRACLSSCGGQRRPLQRPPPALRPTPASATPTPQLSPSSWRPARPWCAPVSRATAAGTPRGRSGPRSGTRAARRCWSSLPRRPLCRPLMSEKHNGARGSEDGRDGKKDGTAVLSHACGLTPVVCRRGRGIWREEGVEEGGVMKS